jgi:hypothetical protein
MDSRELAEVTRDSTPSVKRWPPWYTGVMSRRKTPRSDLPILALWLLVGYLAYKADPGAGEAMKGIVGGVERFLRTGFP